MATIKKGTVKNVSIQLAVSFAVGAAACFIISLVGSLIAVKMGNALSLGIWIAVLCVAGGAFAASTAGALLGKAAVMGAVAGALFTAMLLLFSLVFGGDKAYPLQLLGAAVVGTLGGVAISFAQKPNARRKLKKYLKK